MAAALSLASCTDLTEEYYDSVNSNIYPKNEQDADALVRSEEHTSELQSPR